MATSFDSLGYARHLRERGVPQEQAEAMPDAARTCLMQELLMREDLRLALDDLALRLTVRTGVMIAAAVGILGTLDALMAP